MGILKMATADWQDTSQLTIVDHNDFEISNTAARTGAYSYHTGTNSANVVFNITFTPQASTTYYRFGIKLRSGTDFYTFFTNATANLVISFKSDGSVFVNSNSIYGAFIDSGSYARTEDWHCVEIKLYVHDTSGILDVKIDGITIISFSGNTSRAAGDQSSIGFGGSHVDTAYIDDIIVRDDDWPGRGGIYVLTPNAGSTTEEWTPSSGNPEDCVDEQPPSYDDYISTDTDAAQLFGIESLPITPDTINGVGVFSQTKLNTPGDTYAMSILNAGSTKSSGDVAGLTTGSGTIEGYWALNPDDAAAWEEADITALEVGIETVTL